MTQLGHPGLVLATALLLGPMVLTAMGARRRGRGWPAAALAGVFFPVAWTAWYVRDVHPYRRLRSPTPR